MFWTIVVLAVLTVSYWKLSRNRYYWRRKGVKQGEPTIILGDNRGLIFPKKPFANIVEDLYNRFPQQRYSGVYQFNDRILLLRDIELIKRIAVKDFAHFNDHFVIIPANVDPVWGKNLLALTGEEWKEMRSTLSPTFTSSKIRAMFSLMSNCAERFTENFNKKTDQNVITVEFKDIFGRYANDVIASCAFGIECDSMGCQDNQFYENVREVTKLSGFWITVKFVIINIVPSLLQLLGIGLFDKHAYNYFKTIIKDAIDLRERKLVHRQDMIHLMLEARKGRLRYEQEAESTKETGYATVEESEIGVPKRHAKRTITVDDITAQAFVFFFAGFETVTTLLCFMGYELAVNPEVQERLREEIDETLRECGGKFTYEAINGMKYLDMCVAETLRKWPPVLINDRICTKPYTVQATQTAEPPLKLDVEDGIWIPVYAIHRDPSYYAQPDNFDPERFNEENRKSIEPYTYLPFGIGPRNCIGLRFALLESKVLFVHLLARFELVAVEESVVPIRISRSNLNLDAEGGFWFGLKRRQMNKE